jgi:tetratricopeptide (TPR) repeat protein
MQRDFDTARDEKIKVMLLYYIGVEKDIYDVAFWDSTAGIAHKVGATDIEITSTDRAGFYLTSQGDLKNAIRHLNKAIAIAASRKLEGDMFAPMYHIADAYLLQGDIKNAIDYGYRTLRNAERRNNKRDIVISYSMLGKTYWRIGYPQKALDLHLKALKIAEESYLGAELIALMLYGAGTDYYEMGDKKSASRYFHACKKYIDSIGASGIQAALYSAVGTAHEIDQNLDKAKEYYLTSYDVAKKIESKVTVVNSLVFLANNAYNMGNTSRAKAYAIEALLMARSIKNQIQLPRIALLLKNIYQKQKNYKEALRYNEMYVLYKDNLTNENIQKQAMEREYQYEIEQKEQKNRLLVNQNRIQELVLKQKNYLTAGLLAGIASITIIFFMLSRQGKIKTDQQKMRLEQRLLRTQMNPHFIFNALQAIQNIVLNADKKQAAKYLSLFASLTREVLNNSKEELISMSKEISLVEQYLQLQKLRFGERFEFHVCKGEGIGDNILIPPMLGQPFIENAVEHGMRNVQAGGLIAVSYELAGDVLRMMITDNGYGMNAAPRNNKQHQSMAIAITKERIGIMNKKLKLKAGFEIKDAFPGEHERKGVCVAFAIPVNSTA